MITTGSVSSSRFKWTLADGAGRLVTFQMRFWEGNTAENHGWHFVGSFLVV